MFVEQIIEFELSGPGPAGRTCTLTSTYFYDKTKTSKKNLPLHRYLLLKYCSRQCILLATILAKSLTKFNPKMQDF